MMGTGKGGKGRGGITRLMAVCITRGSLSPVRARDLIRGYKAEPTEVDEKGRTALHHALGVHSYVDRWPYHSPVINIKLIRVLVELCPEVAKIKHEGQIPLHTALQLYPPVDFEVIKIILDAHPDAAKEKDQSGKLPIHLARSVDVAQIFCRANSNAAQVTDNSGQLPLHCTNFKSVELVDFLHLQYRVAVRTKDSRGSFPLQCAISSHSSSPEAIHFLMDANPDAIKEPSTLVFACSARKSVDIIKRILDVSHEGLQVKWGHYGMLPLHFSCKYGRSDNYEIFSLILTGWPNGAREKDRCGKLPLHYACEFNAPLHVIIRLVEAFPGALMVKDDGDRLPFFSALDMDLENDHNCPYDLDDYDLDESYGKDSCDCDKVAPPEVIRYLLSTTPVNAAEIKANTILPFDIAYKNQASYEVMKILLKANSSVHLPKDFWTQLPLDLIKHIFKKYPNVVDIDDDKMLIAAINRNAPFQVIKQILTLYEGSESLGSSPLMKAIEKNYSFDVVSLLYHSNPDALKLDDAKKFIMLLLNLLPDNVLMKTGGVFTVHTPRYHRTYTFDEGMQKHDPAKTIKLLVEAFPKVAEDMEHWSAIRKNSGGEYYHNYQYDYYDDEEEKGIEGEKGNYLLHSALRKNAPFDLIKVIVDAHPDAVCDGDYVNDYVDKRYPLHLACSYGKPSFEVVKTIFDIKSNVVTFTDVNTNLPLHDACRSNADISIIDLLLTAFPDGVKKKGKNRNLPLHMACEAGAPIQVIRRLVEAFQEGISVCGWNNFLPIHLSCQRSDNSEVIKYLGSFAGRRDRSKLLEFGTIQPDGSVHGGGLRGQSRGRGITRLMDVCINRGPHSPVHARTLMQNQNADPIEVVDENGQTALHHALRVRHDHDADDDNDNDDDAVVYPQAEVNLELVRVLLELRPDAARVKDDEGKSPLYLAITSKAPFEIIKLVYDAYPGALLAEDRNGKNALRYASIAVLVAFAKEEAVKENDEAVEIVVEEIMKFARNDAHNLSCVEAGAAAVLTTLARLETVTENGKVAGSIAYILGYLGQSELGCQALFEADAPAALTLLAKEKAILEDACAIAGIAYALVYFANTPAGVQLVINAGAAAILTSFANQVAVMKTHHSALNDVAHAFHSISESSAGQQSCADAGAVSALTALLNEKGIYKGIDVLMHVCGALRNIAKSDDGRQSCVDSGTVSSLTNLLAREKAVIKNEKAVTIINEALFQIARGD